MKRTLTQPALALAATAVLVVGVAHPASATVTVSGGSVTGDGANDFFSVQCTGGVLAASPAVTTGDACATLDSLYVDPGPGTDTVNLTNVTAAAFPSLAGISVYTSDSEADTVNGSPLSETLSGDSLDTISGGGGGDLIVGANSASGGDGDDSFMEISSHASGGAGDDRFIQFTVLGGIDGGPGTDSWELDFDQTTLGLGNVTAAFTVNGGGLSLDVAEDGMPATAVPASGIEQIFITLLREGTQSYDGTGFPGSQHVRGVAGPDTLVGGAHDDSLHGGTGDDTLNGNGGGDVLNGGAGNDTIQARDGVVDRVDCGDGTDTVVADAVDSVVNCESVQLPAVVTPPPPAPVVPDTSKVKGPSKVAKGTTAKFKLKSPTAGATFQCKLDKGKWKTCKATHKVKTTKLKVGKHKLRVRAVVAGTVDPTPAVKKFKVTS